MRAPIYRGFFILLITFNALIKNNEKIYTLSLLPSAFRF